MRKITNRNVESKRKKRKNQTKKTKRYHNNMYDEKSIFQRAQKTKFLIVDWLKLRIWCRIEIDDKNLKFERFGRCNSKMSKSKNDRKKISFVMQIDMIYVKYFKFFSNAIKLSLSLMRKNKNQLKMLILKRCVNVKSIYKTNNSETFVLNENIDINRLNK